MLSVFFNFRFLKSIKNAKKHQSAKIESDSDLTDLSWLTNIVVPTGLSPPSTPPSPVSPQSTAAPVSSEDENDEADSCRQPRSSAAWPRISQLLRQSQEGKTTQRPPFSFSCLAALAIEASQRRRLSVKEIYAWVTSHFPYYRGVPSGSWKNSIRHNLALGKCFAKVDKNLLAVGFATFNSK